jgi:hypothetical protein
MVTIDANAMLVGIMNPVYSQMCANMALQRYIHKENKGRVKRSELVKTQLMKLPSISIFKCFVDSNINLRLV